MLANWKETPAISPGLLFYGDETERLVIYHEYVPVKNDCRSLI
jgi:hypothetical protein